MFWNATNGLCDTLPPRVTRSVWAEASKARPKRPQTLCRQQKSSCKETPTKLGLQARLAPRPSTAPALLTGKGLLVQRSHEDRFLQQLENREVKHIINSHRKELQTQKTLEKAYDLPVEPHYPVSRSQLYELSLYHGSSLRSRTARVQKSKSQPAPVVDQLQELSSMLGDDTRHHCTRLGIPRPGSAALAARRQLSSKDAAAQVCHTVRHSFRDSFRARSGRGAAGDGEIGMQQLGLDVDPDNLIRPVNVGEDERMSAT